MEINNRY